MDILIDKSTSYPDNIHLRAFLLQSACHIILHHPQLTFAPTSPPYGAFSRAPLNAPSVSPPRNNCRIWLESCCTSDAETGATAGRRDAVEKLAEDSGSRRSIFMVRQFAVAMAERFVRV